MKFLEKLSSSSAKVSQKSIYNHTVKISCEHNHTIKKSCEHSQGSLPIP